MFGAASQKVSKMNLTAGDEFQEETSIHLTFEVRALLATCFGKSYSNILQCGPHVRYTDARSTFAWSKASS